MPDHHLRHAKSFIWSQFIRHRLIPWERNWNRHYRWCSTSRFCFQNRNIWGKTAVHVWHLLSFCSRRSPKTTLSNAPHIVLTLKTALSPGCRLITNHRPSWRTWWLTMFDPWCRDAFWSRRQRRRLSDWGRRWTTALSWDPRPQIPPIPPPT